MSTTIRSMITVAIIYARSSDTRVDVFDTVICIACLLLLSSTASGGVTTFLDFTYVSTSESINFMRSPVSTMRVVSYLILIPFLGKVPRMAEWYTGVQHTSTQLPDGWHNGKYAGGRVTSPVGPYAVRSRLVSNEASAHSPLAKTARSIQVLSRTWITVFIFTWATVFTNPHADTFNKSTVESQVSHEHTIFSNYALPYRGAWLPEGHDLITDTHVPDTATHVALLSSNIKAAQLSKKTGPPMIIAIPDSGATANVHTILSI